MGRKKKTYPKLSKSEAKRIEAGRPKRSRSRDESSTTKRKGSIVKDERWAKNPGKYDYPGVDTASVGLRRRRKEENQKRNRYEAFLKKAKDKLNRMKPNFELKPYNKTYYKTKHSIEFWENKLNKLIPKRENRKLNQKDLAEKVQKYYNKFTHGDASIKENMMENLEKLQPEIIKNFPKEKFNFDVNHGSRHQQGYKFDLIRRALWRNALN